MRITNSMRESIRDRVIREAFDDRENKLLDEKHNLGLLIYSKVVSKKEIELMKKLPKDFFYMSCNFKIAWQNTHTNIHLAVALPMPNKMTKNYPSYSLDQMSVLGKKYSTYLLKKEKLKKSRMEYRSKVYTLLHACTTSNKFLELWPDGKKYISPFLVSECKALVPDSLVKDVNAELGNK